MPQGETPWSNGPAGALIFRNPARAATLFKIVAVSLMVIAASIVGQDEDMSMGTRLTLGATAAVPAAVAWLAHREHRRAGRPMQGKGERMRRADAHRGE